MTISGFSRYSEPKISVLLPISRLDNFFEIALDSVINQSFESIEIIILANGLEDSDFEKLKSICSHDDRIILKKLNVCGLMFALNYGIEISKANIIARMDSDDVSLPGRFESQYSFLENNTEVDVVGGRVNLIDSSGNFLKKSFKYYGANEEIISVLPFRNPLCHPALMMRKSALLKVWGYRYGFMSEDHELFIRLMISGAKFHNLDSYVLHYRRHDAQITGLSKAYSHFSEISAFMWMYFYKYKNFKYLLGAVAVYPFVRKVRNLLSSLR